MATRRKTTVIKTEEKKSPPVVTQVVEEVREEVEATPPPSVEEATDEDSVQKEKQVVDELFSGGPAALDGGIQQESPMKSFALWAIVVLVIAAATGGLLIFAVKGGSQLPVFAQPTPTPTPAPTPTPTVAAVNRSDITAQVLNGGGVAGSGAKMKAFLEEKGYTVSDVRNADEFTHEETVVKVKPAKEAYLSILAKDVEENYTVGSASADLTEDSSFDAQVIVGKK